MKALTLPKVGAHCGQVEYSNLINTAKGASLKAPVGCGEGVGESGTGDGTKGEMITLF